MEIVAQAWLHGNLLAVLCSQGDLHLLHSGKVRHTLETSAKTLKTPTCLVACGRGFLVGGSEGAVCMYGTVTASQRCTLLIKASIAHTPLVM